MSEPTLIAGMPAPAFEADTSEGTRARLADWAGRPVVLYFYPKDNTPGCTQEACDFRDAHADLAALDAVVVGVSRDSVKSHAGFRAKHGLPFVLLSDPQAEIVRAYGCWKEKKLYGKTSLGIERSTFVIDGQGVVRRVWRGVSVKGHADEVKAFLQTL